MKHYIKLSLLLVLSLLTLSLAPAPLEPLFTSDLKPNRISENPSGLHMQTDWGKIPLYFIANQGQMDSRVAYYVQGRDKTLYFTPQGLTLALTSPSRTLHPSPRMTGKSLPSPRMRRGDGGEVRRWIVKLDFIKANSVQPTGQEQTQAVVSYFKGSPEEWDIGLPTYSKIVYSNLWEGIDLAYSGTVDRLKYEFVVQPGVDPADIRLAYRGATVRVNDARQLEVSTPAGSFQDDAPVAYQQVEGRRVPVTVSFAMDEAAESTAEKQHPYGFHLGAYDPTLPLVIDPAVLVYCGFIGGSNYDEGNGIVVDATGNAYIAGETDSTEATFPETVGPFLTYSGNADAFVAKMQADGTGLIYAGYIGGNSDDRGLGIAVDTADNAYVVGETFSTQATFPVTVGPDLTFNGYIDAFVAKVRADGTGLVYAGYIGGSGNDQSPGIAVDSMGNAYVIGLTDSTEATFPETVGPDLTYNGGSYDAFVAKVRANGTGLAYAGYIGGSSHDYGISIAVDSEGNAYVSGLTTSTEASFPVTVGPDLTYNGGRDAFVAKVKANGTALDYCGYIGGNLLDESRGIALDTAGNSYVTGFTISTEASFPVTVGPDLTYNGGSYDAFVAKVMTDGTGLAYAGFIGGGSYDFGYGIAVDTAGNAYVTGNTASTEASFPVSEGPEFTYNGGDGDAYAVKVKADGTGLDYCGYIGGNGGDYGEDIAVDTSGNAYLTGHTNSSEATFPKTVGPFLTYSGNTDAFVTKISYVPGFNLFLPLVLR